MSRDMRAPPYGADDMLIYGLHATFERELLLFFATLLAAVTPFLLITLSPLTDTPSRLRVMLLMI